MKVALVSLEPWNEVWRRNQHLASELVGLGLVDELLFIEPLLRRRGNLSSRRPMPGVSVLTPRSPIPRSLGGLRVAGRTLRRHFLHDIDLLWINDAPLGVHCLQPGVPSIYDVTDDWRTAGFPRRIIRRLVSAEDCLAARSSTVVCSQVLHERWQERYGISAPIVHNGVDARLWQQATPRQLPGEPPHVGYVGTLHDHRLDVDLLVRLGCLEEVGTLHLVGPNHLPPTVTAQLNTLPKVRIHGPVPAFDVPSWMLGMDVLITPHQVSPFTLSLDAIKAYEYQAASRPVVATATSGFTDRCAHIAVDRDDFIAALRQTCRDLAGARPAVPVSQPALVRQSWEARARQFWSVMSLVLERGSLSIPLNASSVR